MKVPTLIGIATIQGDQAAARQCYSLTVSRGKGKSKMLPVATDPLTDRYEDPRDDTDSDEERPGALEDIEEVVISEQFPDRIVKIGTKLALTIREDLISFLRSNASAFAWSYEDMPGIPTDIAMHNLSIVPYSAPVRQKRRAFTQDKYRAIQVKVKKLMAINFVREVTYPRWLVNVVMVPKKSLGSWRMYIDYTNLNRSCPEDSLPLLRIDQLIDSTAGYGLLSFMDAFSGYNQIQMNPTDEEHTAFTTDKGLYCYQVMPFGLKNAGATYQRLVNSMFVEVIGTIIEVYVDDMLVKSLTSEDHITNISIVFTIILRNGVRLNPPKCIFGVEVGKFLGYIISHRGIEANPEKVQAILDMISSTYRNEVQSLTGKVAALSRFISRLTDKCTNFFKLLKTQHVEVIAWTAEHEAAFLGLKAYLAEVPLLYKPVPREMLYIYLATSLKAVSSALITKDFDCEYLVYYAGKGYIGAESRYPDIEKIALALLVSARKLRHYFQAHSITVFTNHPLRQVLQKPETSGRLIKWAIELGEFDIKYQPQTAIKGQEPANFISKLIPSHDPPLGSPEPPAPDPSPPSTCPDDQVYEYALKFAFKGSNNVVEYEALVAGLQIGRELGVQHLHIFSYSQLVVNQKKNGKADALAKIATTSPSPAYGATKVEILQRPSTSKTVSEIFMVDHTASWMDPILKYLVDGLALDDNVETWRLQLRFEVPDTIVTDNGTQFDNVELRAYTGNLGTRILYSSPAHPQTNGQVEAVNKIIKKILKKKLDEAKGLWASKLPEVLWAIRTMTTEATGETPFCMAFGSEAVLPIETQIQSPRIEYFDAGTNSEGLQLDADLLEE
ncbi:uncharacterized protein LOC112203984 [Rosa chinensis]|uniref:uncharacterized protein LOC112203984 n=1 Tax=Rosa chinensis TaxID=74649 RepID=UPI000D097589|nr:uncharacterized protein LOC112203984 [Rosa chinensis]